MYGTVKKRPAEKEKEKRKEIKRVQVRTPGDRSTLSPEKGKRKRVKKKKSQKKAAALE